MRLSATSKPFSTCSVRIRAERGMRSGALAMSVSSTPTRSAARKRISLMTFGQASASTQMRTLSATGNHAEADPQGQHAESHARQHVAARDQDLAATQQVEGFEAEGGEGRESAGDARE